MIKRWRRFELRLWNAIPACIALALALVCLLPKYVSGLSHFMPMLTLAPLFFWGTYEARDIPFWVAFALGFLIDSISGQPLGVTSLLNLFFLMTVYAQRKYIHKEGFVIKWGYFALMVGGFQLAAWLGLSFFYGTFLALGTPFFQWLLTVLIYPPLHRGFELLNEHIHQRRWEIIHGL